MGITIYYRGKLRSMEQLPSLVEETKSICKRIGWEYELIHRSYEVPIQGIAFEPKGSHAIWMTFNDDGQLITPYDYVEFGKDLDKNYQADTKTHFAGAGTHMKIVELIRYLAIMYFSGFGMYDESQYWQTRNKAICEKEFDIMERWVRQLIGRLDELDGRVGEIGEAGEIMDERIHDLMMTMPWEDLAEHLCTPRPEPEVMSNLDN